MDEQEEMKYFERELNDALHKRNAIIYYNLCREFKMAPEDRLLYEKGRGQAEIIKIALLNLRDKQWMNI